MGTRRRELRDTVVVLVRDIDVAVIVDRDTARTSQLARAVAQRTERTDEDTRLREPLNTVVALINNIKLAIELAELDIDRTLE